GGGRCGRGSGGEPDGGGAPREAPAPPAVGPQHPPARAARPRALPQHALDARVGEWGRSRRERARHLGDVHGLLRPRRAPERAVVEPDAAAHVARRPRQGPAEALGALHEEPRVAAEGVLLIRLHVQDALGGLEVRLHVARAQAGEAQLALPARQYWLGSSPRHPALFYRAAAAPTPLGQDDWPASPAPS